MRNVFLWCLSVLFCSSTFLFAQQTARVDFRLDGLQASSVQIGLYSAGKTNRIDSVEVDMNTGAFSLSKSDLQPGVYFVAANRNRLFDFILTGPSDSFSIQGDLSDLTTLKVENSPENDAYFKFERQRQSIEAKIIARQSMYEMVSQATNNDPKVMEPIEKEIDAYYSSIDSMARAFIRHNPGHLYARMLQSVRPLCPPKNITSALDGKVNPAYPR